MENDLPALARSLLVLVHLMAIALAAISIAFGDYAIFHHHSVDRALLEKAGRSVTGALGLLWLTGLGILALDVLTAGLVIAESPKLLAKLAVVMALSTNGWLLHRFAFPSIGRRSSRPECAASAAAVLGAFSAVSWGYALFLGVAKAWVPLLGFAGFMAVYALVVVVGMGVALRWVRPILLAKQAALPGGTSETLPAPTGF